jgi:hypothetical protein
LARFVFFIGSLQELPSPVAARDPGRFWLSVEPAS